MLACTIQDIVDSTGAELRSGDARSPVRGVSTDTRTLGPGELFIALSGPNFDGNRFAMEAIERGAAGMMLSGTAGSPPAALGPLPRDVPVLLHPAPRRAMADLARWHRSRLAAHVVGVTGSCGKTTTKNILLALLGEVHRVVGSPSSFNNDIGVPHTLFRADEGTEVLVVEMGTNGPGEIAALCRTARPTAGIITNVGASHLEGLASVEGVAREKGALAAALPRDGFCVLNADCRWTPTLRELTGARVLTFSVDGGGDLDARRVLFHAGGTTFELEVTDERGSRRHEVTSPLLGLHNVQNLLAALTACVGLGIDLERVLPAVSSLEGGHRRMERHDLGELVLFDDTYNANPESARASVRVLCGLHGHARRVLVLGDMLELGALAAEMHHAIGLDAARNGVDLLVCVGELTRASAAGALEGGLAPERVVHVADVRAAQRRVPGLLAAGDVVLVKGSRATGLERLVEALLVERGEAEEGAAR